MLGSLFNKELMETAATATNQFSITMNDFPLSPFPITFQTFQISCHSKKLIRRLLLWLPDCCYVIMFGWQIS
jgi:hypothetical protein